MSRLAADRTYLDGNAVVRVVTCEILSVDDGTVCEDLL